MAASVQKCLEDDRFNPKNFTGDARKIFPTIFVDALSELCLEGTDEIAVEILRVSNKYVLFFCLSENATVPRNAAVHF